MHNVYYMYIWYAKMVLLVVSYLHAYVMFAYFLAALFMLKCTCMFEYVLAGNSL